MSDSLADLATRVPVSSYGVVIRGNLRVSGRYGGSWGACLLDFIYHWMEDAIYHGDPERAAREATRLAHYLLPVADEGMPIRV